MTERSDQALEFVAAAGHDLRRASLPRLARARPPDRGQSWTRLDSSLETTFRVLGVEIGAKGEVFNVLDSQKPTVVSNTAFCADASAPAGSTCATARANFGTYTSRGAYQTPRSFRLTGLVRF